MTKALSNLRIQQIVLFTGLTLFAIKTVAWLLTGSVSILTDALESTVNVIGGFMGLYSIWLSQQPRDANHPYGHGKIEFVSAGMEGGLIFIAGCWIIYEAIQKLSHPTEVKELGIGILLIAVAGGINWLVGWTTYKQGVRTHSLALEASGKHLMSDAYTSLGILVGLILLRWTGYAWIDSAVAMLFAFVILVQGFRIIRQALAGIMDETDHALLLELAALIQEHRRPAWVDIHNLRIIKYGSLLHIDCHLTLPWYLNMHEGHKEVDALTDLIRERFGNRVEFYIHLDGCLPFSCAICQMPDCPQRTQPFQSQIVWTVENMSENSKHRLQSSA
ncbi:MAG: cation transporter [Saprospiraceae bacterium]|nr:cation transporter [Saprospiraceae bacterium]HPG09207.1 cation diffusion facilitator family transporter [Saprospiraceae bacterium]